jgi:signal transduction histidine kinase/ActR/RegA family two-component response regulator
MQNDQPSPASVFRLVGRVLYDIAHVLNSIEHAESRLDAALLWLRRVVPYDRCALLVSEPSGPRLIVRPEASPEEHDALGHAMHRLLSLLSEPGSPQSGAVPIEVSRTLPYGSHLAVPLVGLDVLGVLFVAVSATDGYSEDDLILLSIVASQIGGYLSTMQLAVENRRLYDDSRAASSAKDDFLMNLSHELRTPMNAIAGWTAMLRSKELEASQTDHALTVIQRNTQAMTQLLNDLLDVSRIVAGKVRLETRLCYVPAVIEAALDAVRDVAERKGLDLRSTLDYTVGPILGDPDRLQQIVLNLLSNAIKFSSAGGRIEVGLTRSDGYVQIQVRDQGDGIPAELLPHVFDRFRQGGVPARRVGGLGIGLSIVSRLVELHGGRVSAESLGAGQGSTFTVSLPVFASADPAQTSARRPQADSRSATDLPRLDGVTVLVVDDESDNREMATALLELCGATVKMAASAAEGWTILNRTPVHVVVSDVSMAGDDGYAFIRQVRAASDAFRAVPAIALTGRARPEDTRLAAEAGFDLHVAKPVDPPALCAAVAKLIGRPGAA